MTAEQKSNAEPEAIEIDLNAVNQGLATRCAGYLHEIETLRVGLEAMSKMVQELRARLADAEETSDVDIVDVVEIAPQN